LLEAQPALSIGKSPLLVSDGYALPDFGMEEKIVRPERLKICFHCRKRIQK